ncbi:hypothetical protein HK096_000578, partial [Nowakowskiella sp. JEL0078]
MSKQQLDKVLVHMFASGYQYVWVDILCFEQDNETDKANMIGLMVSIYGNAQATFVCMSEDYQYPGIIDSYASGDLIQVKVMQGRSAAINCMSNSLNCVRLSKWFTRVWTLQEAYLSSKMIVMRKEEGKIVSIDSNLAFNRCLDLLAKCDVGSMATTLAYSQVLVLNTKHRLSLALAFKVLGSQSCRKPEDRYF